MKRLAVLVALLAASAPAQADTLYVAGPPGSAPGHPLRLGADHRAGQVGDLVQVVFNFAVNSSISNSSANSQAYQMSVNPGTGFLNFSLARLGAGFSSGKSSSGSRTASDNNAFTSTMTATVTNVLPSGALAISGDQKLVVNGTAQVLHITGLVRPEDVDSTDSVLSTRVASVEAKFDGNFQDKQGLIHRILSWLF